MTKVESKIQFDRVIGSIEQIRILYDLLISRTHSISHQILPTYKSHKEFVLSNPYIAWFIIRSYSEIVGSFYLKHDNSVGLNLIDQDPLYVFEVMHFIKSNFDPQTSYAVYSTSLFLYKRCLFKCRVNKNIEKT